MFPKLYLREFAIVPTVSDNPVIAGASPSHIIALCRASHSGEGWSDMRQSAAVSIGSDEWRVLTDERFGQTNNIDDCRAFHEGNGTETVAGCNG